MKSISNKTLFFISSAVVIYFLLLVLNAYVFKLNYKLIGVVQEFLTLPVLGLMLFLFFYSIKRAKVDKFSSDKYSFWTFGMLAMCCILTIGSFFI